MFFFFPQLPDLLWGPPSLLCNGYRGLYPRGQSGRGVKLTAHHHLVELLMVELYLHYSLRAYGVKLN
jgi:hypothetical protein